MLKNFVVKKCISTNNNDVLGITASFRVISVMQCLSIKTRALFDVAAFADRLVATLVIWCIALGFPAVIEAMPAVGGYHVHAAKIRRAGVPVLTSHTILSAEGADRVERAVIARVDESWNTVAGSEEALDVDTICLAVGLSPNCELAFQAGCVEAYVPDLGGRVAMHDSGLETSVPGVFIAGDASGIEEASTAMLEGMLAGLKAAEGLDAEIDRATLEKLRDEAMRGLAALRAGPFGAKPLSGKEAMFKLAAEAEERARAVQK